METVEEAFQLTDSFLYFWQRMLPSLEFVAGARAPVAVPLRIVAQQLRRAAEVAIIVVQVPFIVGTLGLVLNLSRAVVFRRATLVRGAG